MQPFFEKLLVLNFSYVMQTQQALVIITVVSTDVFNLSFSWPNLSLTITRRLLSDTLNLVLENLKFSWPVYGFMIYSSKGYMECPEINGVALALSRSFGKCCSKNSHFKYSQRGEILKNPSVVWFAKPLNTYFAK